ncbi:uncharacterized protein RJT20DRAFT_28677 [Scheffersomyces xylosifermentans]|uniref:uncharacterized protein n=1 Tax=Scheffersomyces xylosifermentans TaxID=1304137 RepID=UPI00315CAF48
MVSSGFFNDHHYSPHSSEASGSNSPHIIKPTILVPHKQRSSSVNSITSNATSSNNQGIHFTRSTTPTTATSTSANGTATVVATPNTVRSMSIVSLESPRNSIVSIDENIIRPTRNNSAASLASLSSQSTAMATNITQPPQTPSSMSIPSEYIISHKLRHHIASNTNNNSAILSDDDSELETATRTILKPRLKRGSRSEHFTQIKKDFKFKFEELTPIISKPPTVPSSPSNVIAQSSMSNDTLASRSPTSSVTPININTALRLLQDPNPSPLSLSRPEFLHKESGPVSGDNTQATGSKMSISKKLKSNSLIQQSMYLKKKLIYSKDLQFELLHNLNMTSGASGTDSAVTALNNAIAIDGMNSKFITANTSSNGKKTYINQPIMETLVEQNKLIHDLNKKWNRAIQTETPSTKKTDKKDASNDPHNKLLVKSNGLTGKRSRTYSFDDDDDFDDDYDDYDNAGFGTFAYNSIKRDER